MTNTLNMLMERLDRLERLIRVIGIDLMGEQEMVSRAVEMIPPLPDEDFTALQSTCESDDEFDVLEALAVRSGVLWVCTDESCQAYTHHLESTCTRCGKEKA